MTSFFILIIVLVLTYFAFSRRSFPLSFVAGISWMLLLVYTRYNPLGGLATGSYGDEILLIICLLMCAILLFNGWQKRKEDKQGEKRIDYYNDAGDYVGRYEKPEAKPANHIETPEEHRQRLHQMIMDGRARRNQYRR